MAIDVVSNSGPLMVFSKLNILHLLKELYGRVEFPLQVYEETVSTGIPRGYTDARILNSFFIQNEWRPVTDIKIHVDLQSANLDRGEKEAISLALSNNALLLMDEEQGRYFAREKNLLVRGSLGVLIEAYAKEIINEARLRYYFQQISERKDIWINPDLCTDLLKRIFQS
jgi:predicted nucleic acid-binding protein